MQLRTGNPCFRERGGGVNFIYTFPPFYLIRAGVENFCLGCSLKAWLLQVNLTLRTINTLHVVNLRNNAQVMKLPIFHANAVSTALILSTSLVPVQAQISRTQGRSIPTTEKSSPSVSKPQPSPQQQQNINKLKADLQSIQGKSEVTPQHKQQLADSLMTLAEGTTKPSQASVQKLANDLAAALDDGELSNQKIYQLSQDLEAVLNSANIPQSEVQAVINDTRAILAASNVTSSYVQLIASDLQAIAAELKRNISQVKPESSPRRQRSIRE